MKKDLIFAPALLLVGVVLFSLKMTGLPVHIAVAFIGALILAAYTALCRRDWNFPAIEIGMRAAYGVTLVLGVVIKIRYVAALAVLHRLGGVLFVLSVLLLLLSKVILSKKRK